MTSPAAGPVSNADRFQSLWQRCLVVDSEDQSQEIYQRLTEYYGEPQRHYHTMAHIEHCLGMFDQCKSLLAYPDAVELAIWFHDIIYVPGAKDNEARSAELYQQLSAEAHSDELRRKVDDMIIATLHTGNQIEDPDTQYMVDIDLSSFGLPWDEFLRDSQNLRLENQSISEEEHYRKAKNFQTALLARDRFYLTDFFHELLENRARKNLKDYFDYLNQQR